MLVLTRKPGERIMIGEDIVITFLENRSGDEIRIGIDAPGNVRIKREEIFEAVAAANRQAAEAPSEAEAILKSLLPAPAEVDVTPEPAENA